MNTTQFMPEAIREQKHILRFNKNGEFRILALSDTHACFPGPCEQTLIALRAIVDHEKPDLVLFCGDDMERSESTEELKQALGVMVAYLEENRIPWAHVHGNHDDECFMSEGRPQAARLMASLQESRPSNRMAVGSEDASARTGSGAQYRSNRSTASKKDRTARMFFTETSSEGKMDNTTRRQEMLYAPLFCKQCKKSLKCLAKIRTTWYNGGIAAHPLRNVKNLCR